MIFVRDDDVLLKSSSYADPLERFKQVHRWICEVPDKVLHIPAILVTEIQEFPEAIEYIKEETAEGRMRLEIHGLKHVDYAKLDAYAVRQELKECQVFLNREFNVSATTWYTPWGANAAYLYEAAEAVGLKLVDCSNINKLAGRYGMVQQLKDGHDPIKFLDGKEIFMHWWEGGMRLKRVLEAIKHGSWVEAVKANKDTGLFDET